MQRNTRETQRSLNDALPYQAPVTFADTHGGRKNMCTLASTCTLSNEPDCGGCCPAAELGLLVWAPCEIDQEAYETHDRYFVDEEACYDDDAFSWKAEDSLVEDDDMYLSDVDVNASKESTMVRDFKNLYVSHTSDDESLGMSPVTLTINLDMETHKKLVLLSINEEMTESEYAAYMMAAAMEYVDYDDPLDVAEALVDIRTKTDQLMEVIGETDECLNALCNDVCGVSYDEDELIMGMFE